MTAIITKQNAIDKAFISGYPNEAEFENIHVKNTATIDKDIIFDGESLKVKLLDMDASITGCNKQALDNSSQLTDHETRITTLEQTEGGTELVYEEALDDFIIDVNALHKSDDTNNNILTIDGFDPKSYDGDVFEFILPSFMNLPNAYISVKQAKYSNPVITYDSTSGTYTLTTIDNETAPRLYISKQTIHEPFSLFTSGSMRINYIGKVSANINSVNNKLINFTCNNIEADNCFKLYRSPLPDFYEMNSLDEDDEYYYADWGYEQGSESFNTLIDGQTFNFNDEVFGTTFELTKKQDTWIGNNFCVHIPESTSKRQDQDFETKIYIAKNDANKFTLQKLTNYNDGNIIQHLIDNGLLKISSNKGKLDYIKEDDKYWYCNLLCDYDSGGQWIDGTYTATLTINGKSYEITTTQKGTIDGPRYNIQTNNVFDYIGYHHTEKLIKDAKSIRLYMSKNPNLLFKISDVDYDGGNTFEYLNGCGFYTVSPRPESCSTLFTNYNIQTSGVVIGENIESHMFMLNSLGNTVDIAVNNINELESYCAQLQQQISQLNARLGWYEMIQSVIEIGSNIVMNFGGGLFKIAADGIKGLKGLQFAEDLEFEVEDISRCIHADMVLAPGIKTKELVFDSQMNYPEINVYKYWLDYIRNDYKIIITSNETSKEYIVKDGELWHILDSQNEDNDDNDLLEKVSYIKYKYPYVIIYTETKPDKVVLEYIPKGNQLSIGLGDELKDNQIMTAAAIKKLVDNHKNDLHSTLTDSLTTTLESYALKIEIPTDYVKHKHYDFTIEHEDGSDIYKCIISNPPNTFTAHINFHWIDKKTEQDSGTWAECKVVDNKVLFGKYGPGYWRALGVSGQIGLGSDDNGTICPYVEGVYMPNLHGSNLFLVDISYNYEYDASSNKIGTVTFKLRNSQKLLAATTYDQNADNYVIDDCITDGDLHEILRIKLYDYALKSEIPDLTNYTKKSDLTDYVSNTTLETNLSEYRQKDDLSYDSQIQLEITHKPFKFQDVIDLESTACVEFHKDAHLKGYYIDKEGNQQSFDIEHLNLYKADPYCYVHDFIEDIQNESIEWFFETGEIYYRYYDNSIDYYGGIHLDEAYIGRPDDKLVLQSKIDELTKKIEQINNNDSHTITHYAPIDENLTVNDFIVGAPVYLTGFVYKNNGYNFVPSTETDTIDCICSVKTNGTWKEYVGICSSIDSKNKCIKFVTHGDYMVKVDDSSCYSVGDQVFIDDDNKLKILAGSTAITSKINRMTVGIVSSIINSTTLAVFKS